MNIFSELREKSVPKSLRECYSSSETTRELLYWSESIEQWGKFFMVVLIIIGVLSTISGSFVEVVDVGYYSTTTETEFSFKSFVYLIVFWAIIIYIEYWIYHIIAVLIASLASIVQNNYITANVALYKAAQDESPSEQVESGKKAHPASAGNLTKKNIDGSWVCKKCNTKNRVETIICKGCGEYR